MRHSVGSLLHRLGMLALSLLVLSLLAFVLSRLAPGDPLRAWYGEGAERLSVSERAAAEERLGLSGSLPEQYLHWLGGAVRGDFGLSLQYKRPVLPVVMAALPNTLWLGGLSFLLTGALAVPLGVYCCMREDSAADRFCCRAGAALGSVPAFWVGLLLVLFFSVNLGWLPSGGAYPAGRPWDWAGRVRHLVLPLVTMVLGHLWYFAALVRNRLLDEVRKSYVLLCKAKGLSNHQIVWGHCLPGVLPSYLGLLAVSVPHVLGGTYVVERVFSYPGLGTLCFESVKYHDYNLLLLLVLLTGGLVIAAGALAQTLSARADGRQRREGGAG